MTSHKIISGVEKDPIVYGLSSKYFYNFLIALFIGLFLFAIMSINLGSGSYIYLGVFLFIMRKVYIKLKKKSNQPKHKDSKQRVILANDILLKI